MSVFAEALLSLFFPRTCAMCATHIEEGCLCKRCLQRLPRTEQAYQRQNVTEMAVLGLPSDMVRAGKVMHVDKAAAFLFYEKDHPIQQLIHRMKYADRPELGYQLGRQAALEFQYADFFDEIDLIIPMPLHPKRLRERGYNQSEYIARGISEVTGIPVDTTHVTRVRNTPKQALQTGEQRKTNVADAFAVQYPEQLYHKHILLVDDLITTGETMRACLKAMRQFRGATFTVFSLCKAQ
ncbi:MAG: ComF family protein [Paludibacteraceae bacterium]|nr:ComF family protein [Paludibacteraceae bacterium]